MKHKALQVLPQQIRPMILVLCTFGCLLRFLGGSFMEFVPMQTPRIQTRNGPHTGVAAASQFSFYLPLLPSAEESFARMHNLALHPSGARPKTEFTLQIVRVLQSDRFQTGLVYGRSSMLWDQIQSPDWKLARC